MSKEIDDRKTKVDDFFILSNSIQKKDAETIKQERIEYLKKKLGKK